MPKCLPLVQGIFLKERIHTSQFLYKLFAMATTAASKIIKTFCMSIFAVSYLLERALVIALGIDSWKKNAFSSSVARFPCCIYSQVIHTSIISETKNAFRWSITTEAMKAKEKIVRYLIVVNPCQ